MYYIVALLGVFLVWRLLSYLKWRQEILQPMEKIPGPKRYPIVGTHYLFFGMKRSELFKILQQNSEKHKPFFRTWAKASPEVHIMKPEHIDKVLRSSTLITKGRIYDFIYPWLGDGLLISTGEKWFQRRKMITPTFHFKILEHFMEVFVEKSKLLVDILEQKCNGEIFNIYPYITHCTLDIICETAMGVCNNALYDAESEYVKSLYKASQLIVRRQFTPWPWYQTSLYYWIPEGMDFQKQLKVLHGFTSKVIADRRKILQENPDSTSPSSVDDMLMSTKKRLSFLDLLLLAPEKISDLDIRKEVDTFMFEGHDTTTAGICWTMFLLGNHQEIQKKVYEELESVLGNKKCPEAISDLNDLKYLECCIKEALRIYPSVPIITRRLTEQTTIDGYEIPKDVYCNIHIYKVHRDPEIYPDPMKFDPDRFLPENCTSRHPYAYVPFSAGPRNCIGQKFAMYEEKTLLASILKSYKITAMDTQKSVNELAELILRPEQGVRIKLERRQS